MDKKIAENWQGKCIQSTEDEEQKNTLASSDLKTTTEGRTDMNSFQILESTSQVGGTNLPHRRRAEQTGDRSLQRHQGARQTSPRARLLKEALQA